MLRNILFVCLVSAMMTSCWNKGASSDTTLLKDTTQTSGEESKLVQLGNRLFSIPSPVQTAYMIQSSGASYNKNLLNNSSSYTKYATKTSKSLNLGVYGADLGYVNLYEQTQDGITYLNACKNLADDLGVTGAFDESFQKKFEKNLGNKDSLLTIVSDAYKLIDVYLQNNENNDVGSLILAGGWIESLYFATTVYKTNPTEALKKRIAEQKFSLVNLIKLLEVYSNGEDFAELLTSLKDLNDSFDKVEIQYQYAKPEVKAAQKTTIINSQTEAKISKELVEEITQKIATLRNAIIA